ncbi:MAG: Omp28-related outer membrane protein [Bacteroidia bacterium]|nr:Omp28-related outer membrane protein [Bacteroidia bacterium]NNC85140.1 Omp28-related outer membrane protein [Bacteroidia bacterium]NNM15829.1 Omp28-related outer membrane protein [Bacteroidia bacterium]
MKQFSLLLSLLFVVFTACQKTETEWTPTNSGSKAAITTPGSKGNIGPVPNRFTQKVLIESFTSANEGLSPVAHEKLNQFVLPTNSNVIGVNIHTNDAMVSSMYSSITDLYTLPHEVPGGMVNRSIEPVSGTYSYSPTDWDTPVASESQNFAGCGLAIRAGSLGNTANIDVQVGFTSLISTNLTVNVYLIEHDMSGTGIGFDQANAFDLDNRTSFFSLGDPIVGYKHNHVLRDVLTAPWGDAITSHVQTPGGSEAFNFTANITGYDPAKTHVVAFITEHTAGSSIGKVLNVQTAPLNSLKNWD